MPVVPVPADVPVIPVLPVAAPPNGGAGGIPALLAGEFSLDDMDMFGNDGGFMDLDVQDVQQINRSTIIPDYNSGAFIFI